MDEELRGFLVRWGWAEDIADDVHDAVCQAEGEQDEIEAVIKAMKCIDDDPEHDYTGEMFDCISAWRKEVGKSK